MEHVLGKRYPLSAKDYKLYEEVGEGVSATVYRSLCVPLNEIVAIKVLDLEKCNNDLVSELHFIRSFRYACLFLFWICTETGFYLFKIAACL